MTLLPIIFLAVFGIFLVFLGITIIANIASDRFEHAIVGMFIIFFGIFFVFISYNIMYDKGYKSGQIDALNGKQKYEKVYHYINRDTIPHDSTYILKEEYENAAKKNLSNLKKIGKITFTRIYPATICDTVLDESGALLGEVRKVAREKINSRKE